MPVIHFSPADISVEVPSGTLLHDAAIQAGIDDLLLPCAGTGACGQCLVELISGEAEVVGTAALRGRDLVLACQTRILEEDLEVRLLESHRAALRVVGDILLGEEILPGQQDLSPLCGACQLTVPAASIEVHHSDWLRLIRQLEQVEDARPVRTDISVLGKLAEALRAEEGRITLLLAEDETGIQVQEVVAGHVKVMTLGLAIDVGTTTVAIQLVDLADGRVLAHRTSYNAQMRRGADIITRIDYARTPARQQELRRLVLGTINPLIDEMTAETKTTSDQIRAASIAGNTTMIHLLLGLPPRYIRETPYVPTVNPTPTLTAGEVGLAIYPQAVVSCAPGVGSYVGGDITAGLLCTDFLVNREDVFLFFDVGTNGEIVLGNADWIVTCACSAGPAFEGSGIKCGMRATQGAIEDLTFSDDGREVRYDVIGGGKPAGVCGSGLIALLGQLFLRGIVDPSGHFNTDTTCDRLVEMANTRGFIIEFAPHTLDGHDIVITEKDIENLMRTKAAIFAAYSLLLGNLGLDREAISRVYIAGGFGRYIKVEAAVLIGMLPDLPVDRFIYLGNSALAGAYIALLSRRHRRELTRVAAKMTYIDLSSDPHYMDNYLSAIFLPHTDLDLFPSVKGRRS